MSSAAPEPAPVDVDVDAVAAAVAACPSVAHLEGGGVAEQVATYLPGRRVAGVRVADDVVEVHIATIWDVPIPQAAAEVRAAVAPFAGGRAVTVAVEDITDAQVALPATTGPNPIPLGAGSRSAPSTVAVPPDPSAPTSGGRGAPGAVPSPS